MERLLALVPAGMREFVRRGGYRRNEYTHELVREGERMERVEPPKGCVLTSKDAVKEFLAVEADLLRSEGIDPVWPGFADTTEEPESSE